MIATIRTRAVLAHSEGFEPPATPAEAKRRVRELNADARRRRRDRETERRELQGRARLGPAARMPGARLNVQEIYAERNRPRVDDAPPAPEKQPPRSFADLARQAYGAPAAESGALIPATGRGGVR